MRLVLVPAQDQIDPRLSAEQIAVGHDGLVGESDDQIGALGG